MSTPPQIRVAVVDDHSLFAESLNLALRWEGFVAERIPLSPGLVSPTRLVATIQEMEPAIALVDLDLGEGGSGCDLIEPLHSARIAVVMVTSSTDKPRWGECVSLGARTVIPKTAPLSEIIRVIRRVSDGLPALTPEERSALVDEWHREVAATRGIRARLDQLTRTEATVLGELMAGLQVSDIARERVVSESTVRTQVKSILAKLEVSSQLSAVGLAHRSGWLPPRGRRPSPAELSRGPTAAGPGG